MTAVKMLKLSKYRTHSFIAGMFEGEEKMISIARMNCAPRHFNPALELPRGFMDFLAPLHKVFTPRQRKLVDERAKVLAAAHRGLAPDYGPPSEATTGNWMVEPPEWAWQVGAQTICPADDAELAVETLNSGAPGVTLDLEDSMANYWPNLTRGVRNIIGALTGELRHDDRKGAHKVTADGGRAVIFTRPRGLHLNQAGVMPDDLISASLFDVALIAYQVDPARLRRPLAFYIPKSESAEEALWWRDLFQAVERARGWPQGWIKCVAMVESLPLAYQVEEFVYNLRERIVGLSQGRWNYLASLIHFNLSNPEWTAPDRDAIPHDAPFFERLRHLLLEICQRRSVPLISERAGGTASGERRPDAARRPDLRPAPNDAGRSTVAGARDTVRTVIRYRANYLRGKGASLLDGRMEDLATDRLCRLMIAQRTLRCDAVTITDEAGRPAKHAPEFVSALFDEELEKILREIPPDAPDEERESYWLARLLSEQMIRDGEFDPE